MGNTITKSINAAEATAEKRASTWRKKMSEREARIRAGTYKQFETFSQLNNWVNSELNQRLYKIKEIDWEKNIVAIEGRPVSWK